jgi:hypothetical protein
MGKQVEELLGRVGVERYKFASLVKSSRALAHTGAPRWFQKARLREPRVAQQGKLVGLLRMQRHLVIVEEEFARRQPA